MLKLRSPKQRKLQVEMPKARETMPYSWYWKKIKPGFIFFPYLKSRCWVFLYSSFSIQPNIYIWLCISLESTKCKHVFVAILFFSTNQNNTFTLHTVLVFKAIFTISSETLSVPSPPKISVTHLHRTTFEFQ